MHYILIKVNVKHVSSSDWECQLTVLSIASGIEIAEFSILLSSHPGKNSLRKLT